MKDNTARIEKKVSDSDIIKINLKSYVRFWSTVIKKQVIVFAAYGLFLIFMASLTPLFTYIWKVYIDKATTSADIYSVLIVLLIYIILRAVMDLCYFFAMRFMDAINFSSWRVLDTEINRKATKIKPEFYEIPNIQSKINRAWEFSHGDYIRMYQLGLDTIRHFTQLIGILVALYLISPMVSLLALLSIFPAIASKLISDRLSFQSNRILSNDENELNYYKNAIIDQSLIKEIILNNAFLYFFKKYKEKAKYIFKTKIDVEFKRLLLLLTENTIRSIVIFICIFFAATQIVEGKISMGGMAAIITLIFNVIYTLTDFVHNVCFVFTLTYNINQFYEFIDLDDNNNTSCISDIGVNDNPGNEAIITFSNVYYRYPLTNKYVIKNLNVEIRKGQHVAIVGANGSGKTTFIKLLLKLIEPSSGTIKFKDNNLTLLCDETYWTLFSTVFQDYNKYKDTLRYNVAIGDTNEIQNTNRIRKSLEDAGFDKNIDLDCMLSREFNGIELSGGEWQKVAIARAFFRSKDILILDEPTAAIDPIRESFIYRRLFELSRNKTTIFVTHRLGSVLYSDLILFFDNGELVEYGKHDELLSKNGPYAKFWKSQTDIYNVYSNLA